MNGTTQGPSLLAQMFGGTLAKLSVAAGLTAMGDSHTTDYETSLLVYSQAAWPIIEPSTRFQAGWEIEAVCAHLQAVTDGEIRRLLITIPPRSGKSTTASVMWPTWTWTRTPQTR